MKTVYLNRHAKSDWSDGSLRDFDRPLNPRGLRDSPKMGKRLATREEKIDLFVTSPANRAISTARIMANQFGYPLTKIKEVERLYMPSARDFLVTINELDEDHDSAILFAHNPGITSMVYYLTGEDIVNMPTCGIAKINFPSADSWAEISAETGTLVFFDYPKNEFKK